jgi:hypothetical protein
MIIKQLFKPDWRKIVIFVIILILSNIPFIGYFEEIIEPTVMPYHDYDFVNVFNPILNPIFWLWGGKTDTPLAYVSYSGLGNSYYILMILNVVYWYILSCLIVWIYDKYFKKVKKK